MILLHCSVLLSYTNASLLRIYSLTQLTPSLPLHAVSIILHHRNIVLLTQCCALPKHQGFEGNGNMIPFSFSWSEAAFTRKNVIDRKINNVFITQIFSVNFI